MTQQVDVAIIGAGPVGLFAVFQCGMLGLSTAVIDALGEVGGQCTALYPEKPIYDIPGFPEIAAAELIDRLERQAAPFRPRLHLNETVMDLIGDADAGYTLTGSGGSVVQARAVILAAGVGAFGPNRPPLDGIEAYEGRSIHYFVRRRSDFAGKRVVIAGGGDSAVDWAVSLAEVAAHVAVVHRRDVFRAAPEMVSRLRALAEGGRVEMVTPAQLAGLEGANGQLTGVAVEDFEGNRRLLAADCLLPFYGLAQSLGPILDWGLAIDRHTVATDPATAETSRAGIYAIGDIAQYPGKLKLILCGFAEAAQAAHAIRARLFPDQAHHFTYSTTSGVKGL